jgi:SAM-dependent methyltransferase
MQFEYFARAPPLPATLYPPLRALWFARLRVMDEQIPEHVAENRRFWDESAHQWVASGEAAWTQEPSWGMWEIPDEQVDLLPHDMSGLDAIELGCGTAYWSGWLARRGAKVVGVDISEGQLATARGLATLHGVDLTLINANAEAVPYADESFDVAFSEYGAAIWCDPYVWIPEAHRLLRPGGTLTFLGMGTLALVCLPPSGVGTCTERLERDYFGLHRVDWRNAVEDPGGIEFNLPISEWFALFRQTGFDVLDFRELRAPDPSADVRYFASADWAHRFPSEQIWHLRKRDSPLG